MVCFVLYALQGCLFSFCPFGFAVDLLLVFSGYSKYGSSVRVLLCLTHKSVLHVHPNYNGALFVYCSLLMKHTGYNEDASSTLTRMGPKKRLPIWL